MLAAWKKEDPPANRVKPIPISVIRRITFIAQHLPPNAELLRATADMIIIAFFFLLRPGEYTDAPSDTTPFTLGDVQLAIGDRRLPLDTATDAELEQARTASLTFTTQKNGVENEVIRHFLSGDPYICAVKAIKRRVSHLRSHKAPLSTPLGRVYTGKGSRTQSVTPSLITKTLRSTVDLLGADLDFSHRKCPPDPYEPPALWRYWLPKSTPTSSKSLAVGAPTRCSDTSTSRPNQS